MEVFGDRQVVVARELTKKFEEYIRGKLSEVIEECDNLKGEMVVVVEGNEEIVENVSDERITQEGVALANCGKSSKEIVAILCDKYNLKKNYVYNLICKK